MARKSDNKQVIKPWENLERKEKCVNCHQTKYTLVFRKQNSLWYCKHCYNHGKNIEKLQRKWTYAIIHPPQPLPSPVGSDIVITSRAPERQWDPSLYSYEENIELDNYFNENTK